MKSLKFKPELCELILAGEKTTTWRLFDDKDLQVGDKFSLVNQASGQIFGVGKIKKTEDKNLRHID